MGSKKLLTALLATGLAEATCQDEKAEGCDLSAGMFGPAVSEWLRSTAAVIDEAQTDSAMLDWIVRNDMLKVQGSDARGWSVMDCSNGLTFVTRGHKSYREAIAAAMKEFP